MCTQGVLLTSRTWSRSTAATRLSDATRNGLLPDANVRQYTTTLIYWSSTMHRNSGLLQASFHFAFLQDVSVGVGDSTVRTLDFETERSQFQLPAGALPGNNSGQVVYT